MSVTTRSIGYNWTLKLWTTNPTCTSCSTDADAIRFTVGTCTVIGGMDTIDLGGTRELIDVTSFEDTINKQVAGRISLDPINISGNYDGTCSTQRTLLGDIFHEGVVASSTTVRVFSATDTILKRKHSWKGYVTSAKINAGVKNKATFSITIVPLSKVQVCTTT
jgi:hypothetical protein